MPKHFEETEIAVPLKVGAIKCPSCGQEFFIFAFIGESGYIEQVPVGEHFYCYMCGADIMKPLDDSTKGAER